MDVTGSSWLQPEQRFRVSAAVLRLVGAPHVHVGLSEKKSTHGLLYEQLHFEFVISLLRTEEKLKKSSIRREESTVQKSSSGFEHAIHIPFDVPFIARLKKVPDSSLCLKKSTRTSIMRGL